MGARLHIYGCAFKSGEPFNVGISFISGHLEISRDQRDPGNRGSTVINAEGYALTIYTMAKTIRPMHCVL